MTARNRLCRSAPPPSAPAGAEAVLGDYGRPGPGAGVIMMAVGEDEGRI